MSSFSGSGTDEDDALLIESSGSLPTSLPTDSFQAMSKDNKSPSEVTDMEYTDHSELFLTFFTGLLLGITIFLVILGNLLVIAAVVDNRRLRTTVNYYFVISLAVADLLLGLIVLPFSMITIVVNDMSWKFGRTWCNLLTCFDVTLCTASILNLFLTICERYIAIVTPFHYRRFVTKKSVPVAIGIVWLLSGFCSFVPIHMGWNTLDGMVQNTRPNDDPHACAFEFNKAYNTTISVTTFFIPLVFLAFANFRILRIARSQKATISKQQKIVQNKIETAKTTRNALIERKQNSPRTHASENIEMEDQRISNAESRPKMSRSFSIAALYRQSTLLRLGGAYNQAMRHFAAEHKATITILTIVGFFVACWLPYFILFTVKPFLKPEQWNDFNSKHPNFELSLVWLGYANSLCNPIIYACINRHYRVAIGKLLRFYKKQPSGNISSSLQYSQSFNGGNQNSIIYSGFNDNI